MKKFKYNGLEFQPFRQLNKQERNKELRLELVSIGINSYDNASIQYNYDDFYKQAKKVGAQKIDVFLYDGIKVVPCTNELFELKR
ncbi:hypothetical protein SAMN04489761_3483 [Tenacibaculum sp. MAR_2009_124]|uniref:hypothetical protein n=1 Tax=Tenacibaculum sp. MAR_2009_124 TaxID=1250059 RepID=UPI00089B1A46|nr:hypothetical protein [Tenacibaculum sp. MAR_2009_124]SEC63971.1 hypothetical protein SAMN04489761_3365 [Tenacibaculum sp. MAR_2009_124]SEC68008.1 hypothetical protein SAMN04489761_3483 [Tenacibaculum sp. MAR_2009_124]